MHSLCSLSSYSCTFNLVVRRAAESPKSEICRSQVQMDGSSLENFFRRCLTGLGAEGRRLAFGPPEALAGLKGSES